MKNSLKWKKKLLKKRQNEEKITKNGKRRKKLEKIEIEIKGKNKIENRKS